MHCYTRFHTVDETVGLNHSNIHSCQSIYATWSVIMQQSNSNQWWANAVLVHIPDVLIAVMEQTNFSTSFYIHDNKVDYLGSSDILDEAGNGITIIMLYYYNYSHLYQVTKHQYMALRNFNCLMGGSILPYPINLIWHFLHSTIPYVLLVLSLVLWALDFSAHPDRVFSLSRLSMPPLDPRFLHSGHIHLELAPFWTSYFS